MGGVSEFKGLEARVHQVWWRLVWLQLNGDGRRVGNEVREVEVRVCRRAQW